MNGQADEQVDLSPLAEDFERRAASVGSRLRGRIAAARRGDQQSVRRALAKVALPVGLAAAAVFALLIAVERRPAADTPEPFAVMFMRPGPARAWIVQGRRPDIEEFVAVLGGAP